MKINQLYKSVIYNKEWHKVEEDKRQKISSDDFDSLNLFGAWEDNEVPVFANIRKRQGTRL